MLSDDRSLERLRLELAWLSGRHWWGAGWAGGAGAILRFRRVRPRSRKAFQPHAAAEITPDFLDRTIQALRRWKFDVVGMDEVTRRAMQTRERRRFAALTFDGAYQDVANFAYPILRRHQVPFTIYVPTAFPDALGEAWWLALEQLVAREDRITLLMGDKERRFDVPSPAGKQELFTLLEKWLRSLSPVDRSSAIRDLCKRFSIDLAAISREASMTWDDLTRLAADPLVTIGSATVDYSVLASMDDAAAMRELAMGKAVAEAALLREVKHFAYPFGDRTSFRRDHVVMAKTAGFASAASAISGIVDVEGRTNLYALPRISWDGRRTSLRMMHVLLSGVTFPRVKPTTMRRAG